VADDLRLCRRCGLLLDNEATRAMGICGSCLMEVESRPPSLPRPQYGSARGTPPPDVPRID